ncbi:MAG: UDP-N-acetylmuramoyl-L-alanine--D-glutamate ligase [Acidobacteriia bacterium]|nr:UDP-N-acetylmuramoyl-L-alanine--D-glutamate ligase [Terriglobia bacterium]
MREVRGRRALVVGLAKSGRAVALVLHRHGAQVTVTDVRPPSEFAEVIPELLANKIGLELGSQSLDTFLRHDLIVVSPGVPWDLPQLQAARERRIEVLPEVEVASWFLDGTLVGVTGSNGKTTTVTLLAKMFEASGLPTFLGGNIGTPLSLAEGQYPPGAIYVTELSSFQLEAIQDLRPRVAVFLNISPNHLDRHPSFEAYAQAKRQIFRNQQAEDIAVLNADDPHVCSLAPALAARKVLFSRRQQLLHGVFVSGGRVIYRVGHLERALFETREVKLRGAFNLEDVLAATAAACMLGAEFGALRRVVREFEGVEHRLEYVRTIAGVEFYNNSKATSVDATAKTLEAFEKGVHLILGGKDKGAPYTPLHPLIKKRVREVLLIGAAAERIAKDLPDAAPLVRAGNLETAVYEAFRHAEPGDVVLLAPACSSFDQFENFEHRGRVFKELVHRLTKQVESGEIEKPAKRPAVVAVPATTKAEAQPPAAGAQVPVASEAPPPVPPALEPPRPEVAAPARLSPDHLAIEERSTKLPMPGSASAREAVPAPTPPETKPAEVPAATPLAATPTSGLVPEPTAPESPPCELVYVYEVESQELPAGETELVPEYPEEIIPGKLEKVQDEPLPYESRSADASGAAEDPRSESQPVAAGVKGSRPNAQSAGTSSDPDQPAGPASQRRLPGVD